MSDVPIVLARSLDNILAHIDIKRSASFREIAEIASLDPKIDFIGATLRNMDFRGEDLRGFNFRKADLSGSDFRNANVNGVSFRSANLHGVIGLPDPQNLVKGREAMKRGDFLSAIEFFSLALKDGTNAEDQRLVSLTNRLIAACWERLNEFDHAEKFLQAAIDSAEKHSADHYESVVLMAEFHGRRGSPSRHESVLQEAFRIARAYKSTVRLVDASSRLFRYYMDRREFEIAERHVALMRAKFAGDHKDVGYRCWVMLAEIHERSGNFYEAERCVEKAADLDRVVNPARLASDFGRLADLAGARGAHPTRRRWLDLKKEVLVRLRAEKLEQTRLEQLERAKRRALKGASEVA